MEDILGRAKSLGIKFKKEMEEDLDRLSELQLLLQDAERERVYFGQRRNRYDLAGRGFRQA